MPAQALNHESSQIPSVPLEAVLVMDKKLDCVNLTGGKLAWKERTSFCLGPELPPSTNGAPLNVFIWEQLQ